MKSVMSALRDTVPINQFNRGLAGKIFEEVKKSGAKVVMKNNTAQEEVYRELGLSAADLLGDEDVELE